jgi:hypothetical protein
MIISTIIKFKLMGLLTFQEIVESLAPKSDEPDELFLPLCHTTVAGYIMKIITNNISPQRCNKYNEDLSYFFYGKASYQTADELANYTDNPPITFIFSGEPIKKFLMKRILPFDSGGISRFKLSDGFDRESFAYTKPEPNIFKVLGFIKLIYGDHKNYINEQVDLETLSNYTGNCLEIVEIIKMYEKVGQGQLESGSQIYSIEIQFDKEIAFNPSHVVVAFQSLSYKFWENFKLKFPKIKLVIYGKDETIKKNGKALTALEYQTLMREKVAKIVEKQIV